MAEMLEAFHNNFLPRMASRRHGLEPDEPLPRRGQPPPQRTEELAALSERRPVSSLAPNLRLQLNAIVGRGLKSGRATGFSEPIRHAFPPAELQQPEPAAREPVQLLPEQRPSKKKLPEFGGGGEKCLVCGTTAYAVERIQLGKHSIHRTCCCCTECGTVLCTALGTEAELVLDAAGVERLYCSGRGCTGRDQYMTHRAEASSAPPAIAKGRAGTAAPKLGAAASTRAASPRPPPPRTVESMDQESASLRAGHFAQLRGAVHGRSAAAGSGAPLRPSRQSSASRCDGLWRCTRHAVDERTRSGSVSPEALALSKQRLDGEILSELAELRLQHKVAELLHSAFRRDLEELLALHAELASHGLHPALAADVLDPATVTPATTFTAPTTASAASAAVPLAGADVVSVEARLLSLERTMQEQLSALNARWETHAHESRQMTQLLCSSFSLGLSLQEQQARSTAALCALASRLDERRNEHCDERRDERPPNVPPAAAVPPASTDVPSGSSLASSAAARVLLEEVARQQETLLLAVERLWECRNRQDDARTGEPRGRSNGRSIGRSNLRRVSGSRRGTTVKYRGSLGASGGRRTGTGTDRARDDDDDDGDLSARGWSAPPPLSPRPLSTAKLCLLCEEQPADAVLYRCGHRCACLRCAHYMRHQRQPCPLCRAPIDDVIRVYE